MASINIGGRLVGTDYPVYVIAEAGQNHNASLELAFQLVDAAVDAGCQAIKFQKRTPSLAVPEHMKSTMRDTPIGQLTYLEYREWLEFSANEYDLIFQYCTQKGIAAFASVWDVPSIGFLASRGVPAIKIPSASLTDDLLLEASVATGLPIILSTGMSTMEEIHRAAGILHGSPFVMLHCNSTYPCPPEDLNLNCIRTLQALYPDVPIGFSSHAVSPVPALIAASMGACMVEVHLTLDRSMWGTDQSSSLEPNGLEWAVKHIQSLPVIMGDGRKVVTAGEIPIRDKLRKVRYGEART